MLDKLNEVPWKQLRHAYGSAEDVPDLLRDLRTAPSIVARDEDSPLWCLFGNIWHQGTVYEATSYAVPFLLELAADEHTPDRTGILALLAEIARGESGATGYAVKAHDAVAAGLDLLVRITNENSDLRLAAAHVLAQLPEFASDVGPLLRRLLNSETRSVQRAGLILLLGDIGDQSDAALSVLTEAVNSPEVAQRQAAAVSISRLKTNLLPSAAQDAILETLTAEECVRLVGLPWDAEDTIDQASPELLACLNESDRDAIADKLISTLESGAPSVRQVALLVDLLFPTATSGPTPRLTAQDLSPVQKRAVVAMVRIMEGGKRIFYSHFPCWGLPDTMREWRNLAAGRQPLAVDMSLPLLADPRNPRKGLQAGRLKLGQKVLHRRFGIGIVTRIESAEGQTDLIVDFEEEGEIHLLL